MRAHVLNLGFVPYREAWELQRSLADEVARGAAPDTVLLLEHPPVITLGRRTEPGELHIPQGAKVEIVETDRGGKSTYHGPGQLSSFSRRSCRKRPASAPSTRRWSYVSVRFMIGRIAITSSPSSS